MTYAPGAPAAVWAIPSSELSAGVKLTLLYLWSKADHEVQRSPRPCTVWVAVRYRRDGSKMRPVETLLKDIAEGTGAKPATVKKHLVALGKAGLAMHDGRMVDLLPPCRWGWGVVGGLGGKNGRSDLAPWRGSSSPSRSQASPSRCYLDGASLLRQGAARLRQGAHRTHRDTAARGQPCGRRAWRGLLCPGRPGAF